MVTGFDSSLVLSMLLLLSLVGPNPVVAVVEMVVVDESGAVGGVGAVGVDPWRVGVGPRADGVAFEMLQRTRDIFQRTLLASPTQTVSHRWFEIPHVLNYF